MRAFVDTLVGSRELADQIVFRHEIPAARAEWGEPREPIPAAALAAARRLGVERLYSHQARALDLIREGRDVALVTPTASGKSLVFYLPTAEMLADGEGHALYLFPHKALEHDQLEKLSVFGRALMGVRDLTADIYDGDTSAAARKKIRARPPDVLITNPDMLHLGLLAYHGEWARFFAKLRLIVVDELHVYRGVFGSHFAHVMRRLARVLSHYGADPRYLVGSATVGNAEEFAEKLLGRPVVVVSRAGSPRAGRHFLFVNPVASPYTTATRIFVEAVRAGLRTIAFTKARKITELIHSWVEQGSPDVARRVASYRAGYLPEERREIERRLFRGELTGVVATSALELGIDVGGLDVCILVGYPGSVMSSWQRIGRVGRQGRESLVVLVAQPDALDQYFMTHPEEFFQRGFEPAVVDPSIAAVAGAHIVCAGAEIPFAKTEAASYPGGDGIPDLIASGRLVEDGAGERYYSLKRRPHREVNLRSGGESYAILADDGDRPIGTIDGVRVFHECHEGAVYLHAGTSYRIVRLDEESKRVLAVPFHGDYYTQALGSKETEILETHRETEREGYILSLGRLKVTVLITEYARKRLRDQETIGRYRLDVPPIVFETVGLWVTLPDSLEKEAARREVHFMGGLHGGEHAMISLFPLLALCDRSDIGGISYSRNHQLGAPAIFIYDGHPGGIGLTASVHDRIDGLFRATRSLLESCPCEDGCPSCVQSPKCGSGNRPLDKESARMLLRHLTGVRLEGETVAGRPLAAASFAGPAPTCDAAEGLIGPASTDPPSEPRARTGDREPIAIVTRTRLFPDPRPHGRRPPGAARPAPSGIGSLRGVSAADPASRSEGRPTEPLGGAARRDEPATSESPSFRLREDEGRVLVFDVETQLSAEEVGGWDRIRDMKIALAVVLDVRSGRYTTYFEKDVDRLVLDLVMADRVIGYNSERFDLAVVSGYGDWDLSRIRSFDMLKYIRNRLGFRLRLGDLAEANLGTAKSADGLQSLAWFKEGRLDLIEEYCRRDVEVTARLFFLGRERGYLLYRDYEGRAMRLATEW